MMEYLKTAYFKTAKVLMFIICFMSSLVAANSAVIYPQFTLASDEYAAKILVMALNETQPSIKVLASQKSFSTYGKEFALKGQEVDVIWQATSNELESKYRAIRIPVFKGLFGYKTLLIRDGEQTHFSNIVTSKQLQIKKLGIRRYTNDTLVFQQGGFDIITSGKHANLLHMLEGGRLDAIPSSAFERLDYQPKVAKKLGLVEAPNLLLSYVNPVYFFVNRENERLASAIETGLEAMIEDGRFEQQFLMEPIIRAMVNELALEEKTVIAINNQSLPSQTPVARRDLWLDVQASSSMVASSR